MLRGLTSHSFYCASVLLRHIKAQPNISGIRETLRRTPEDIDHEIVQNVLYTINLQCEAQAKLGRRILALLTAAKEPMTAEAVCHALGMSYVLDTEQLPRELEKDLIPDVGVLVKCCEGLITIDPVTRLVTPAQDDIAECMRRQRSEHLLCNINCIGSGTDHFSYQEMTMLAVVSLAYLSMSIFEEGPCHRVVALRERLDVYPFLEYAVCYWGYHVYEVQRHPYFYLIEDKACTLLRKVKNLESVLQVRDLKADVVGLREALQKGKEDDQVLDATLVRSGISALQVVSGYGLTLWVKSFLPKPDTSLQPDSFGTSAMHEAAQAGWDDIVKILIEAGFDPFPIDRHGKSPLYYAARSGCNKAIYIFRGSGKMRDNYYEIALAFFEAIEAGNAHVVESLLVHMKKDTMRERPTTLISIRAGHLNILETIFARGAALSCPDFLPSDQIPLHQAIKRGRADMAELLLDRGAKIQTQDDKKRNAIFETLKAPNTDGLSLLLDRGIRIDCCDSEGNTVLHQAAVEGLVEHARLLIAKDMRSEHTFNDEGLTPLHLAVRAQQSEMVDMLLNSGKVDVNIEGRGRAAGWTPLTYAMVAGSLKLCDTLIQNGAHLSTDLETLCDTLIRNGTHGSTDITTLCAIAAGHVHYTIDYMLMVERRRPKHD